MMRDAERRMIVAGAALAVFVLVGVSIVLIDAAHHESGETFMILSPCATEDSDNCYWDAETMGDGNGTSFVDIDGIAYYPEGVSK